MAALARFFVSARLCCCGGQLEGEGGEMAREGLKMGKTGTWRGERRRKKDVVGLFWGVWGAS